MGRGYISRQTAHAGDEQAGRGIRSLYWLYWLAPE
jgi:hypothetical protein